MCIMSGHMKQDKMKPQFFQFYLFFLIKQETGSKVNKWRTEETQERTRRRIGSPEESFETTLCIYFY